MSTVQLNQLCSKGSSSLRAKDVANDGPYPVYGASGIMGTSSSCQFEKPYVAIVKDGAGVGRACVCEAHSSILGTMQALIPNQDTDLSYLSHLASSLHLETYASGATIPHIYFKDYGKHLVKSLNVGQQVAVAARLDEPKRLMGHLQVMLEKLDELVKSRFVEMFEGAENSYVEIQSVCLAIVDCPHTTPKYEGEERPYPAIRTSEIQNGTINWGSMKYVGKDEYEERTKRLVPMPGDVVYAREGTYGDAAILPDCYSFCLGQRVMLFRPDASIVTSEYLHAAIISSGVKRQADKLNLGSTVPHVNVKDAKRFTIPLPHLSLQQEFAAFVAQVDKLKLAVQQSIDKLQELYDSLAQEYFGGDCE